MSQRLNREGFHCETAATANEAIQRLQEGGYESLISDIHMEGNVQLEFVARVAATAAGLPVIVLTGYPTVKTAARAVGLRVTAYLTKPPDLGTLCSTLRDGCATAGNAYKTGVPSLSDCEASSNNPRPTTAPTPCADTSS